MRVNQLISRVVYGAATAGTSRVRQQIDPRIVVPTLARSWFHNVALIGRRYPIIRSACRQPARSVRRQRAEVTDVDAISAGHSDRSWPRIDMR